MTELSTAELLHGTFDNGTTLQTLYSLKDDLVGQITRKEFWIGEGIIPFLARILRSYAACQENHFGQATKDTPSTYTEKDEVGRQAITIITSLATGM